MDNTFFSSITTDVVGVVDLALVSAVVIAALILGSTVGYRVYKRFTA